VFTGLVEAKGVLVERAARGSGALVAVRCTLAEEPLSIGESVAVDGVCLSVEAVRRDGFEAHASAETLARTTLSRVRVGTEVNLERALRAGARMGGHVVTGHVDGVGSLVERRPLGAPQASPPSDGRDTIALMFAMPRALAPFVAEKGSIAVNGVSLTVNAVSADRFEVAIIPITRAKTNFDTLRVGDEVNLEVDLMARYVARYLAAGGEGAKGGGT
jgi:riboflavin synthase